MSEAASRTAANEPAMNATNLACQLCDLRQSSPHNQRRPLLGELVNVLLGHRVALVETAFKEVWELVELAESPLGVRCILPAPNI